MKPLLRRLSAVALLISASVLAVSPADAMPAAGSRPTRAVIYPEAQVIPAGFGCAFDVLEEPLSGWSAATEFTNGAFVLKEKVDAQLTNAETGASFVHKARFHDVERVDPASGVIHGVTSGQVVWSLNPGDAGPSGLVEDPGAFVRIVGTVWWTLDPDADVMVDFAYKGTIEDVCALIS